MDNSFVNRKDRIIASAIEIISEAGMESLNTRTLAMKENMSESLLYRYFGGIDEVLVEVVETYVKFDPVMIATIEAKDISHLDRVLEFLKTLSTYYDGYNEMSAIVLNYEGLLHNVNTRDIIANCIAARNEFLRKELQAAIEEGEIIDDFTPEELASILYGTLERDLLYRRIKYNKASFSKTTGKFLAKFADMLKKDG